jgi:hypothetical protein
MLVHDRKTLAAQFAVNSGLSRSIGRCRLASRSCIQLILQSHQVASAIATPSIEEAMNRRGLACGPAWGATTLDALVAHGSRSEISLTIL